MCAWDSWQEYPSPIPLQSLKAPNLLKKPGVPAWISLLSPQPCPSPFLNSHRGPAPAESGFHLSLPTVTVPARSCGISRLWSFLRKLCMPCLSSVLWHRPVSLQGLCASIDFLGPECHTDSILSRDGAQASSVSGFCFLSSDLFFWMESPLVTRDRR